MDTLKKQTTASLRARKAADKIVAITAYDFTMAKLVDELVDVILVGDSLGMVVQGAGTTLGVTMDQMVYHVGMVARGAKHAHVVADMPFLSYQASPEDALRNAGRLLAQANAQSVKLEGGVAMAPTIEKLVSVGIPVMGHIGLTPQSVHAFGGYKIQGRTDNQREALITDAIAVEKAGAFCVVLEGMPTDLAKTITETISIPTIGIGAGPHCDGQILVSNDLLGMDSNFAPRFVKKYAALSENIKTAVSNYAKEVREGEFPSQEHSF